MTEPVKLACIYWGCSDMPNASYSDVDYIKKDLIRLKRRFGANFVPRAKTVEEQFDTLFNLIFPQAGPFDYLISNVSVEDRPSLMIRPAVALPSLVAELPKGVVLALSSGGFASSLQMPHPLACFTMHR